MKKAVWILALCAFLSLTPVAADDVIKVAEIQKLPVARDPWALLQTVPGVLVDRNDIAGTESGVQSAVWGAGSNPQDTIWKMDGALITDMSNLGTPTAHFDFDSFEEMQVQTGGFSAEYATSGGAVINIITKRGGDNFKGQVAGYYTPFGFRKSPTNEMTDQGLVYPKSSATFDISGNIGGPILKDHLWFFGSFTGKSAGRKTEADLDQTNSHLSGYGKVNYRWGKTTGDLHLDTGSRKTKGGSFLPPSQQDLDSLWEMIKPATVLSGNANFGLGKFGFQARTIFNSNSLNYTPSGEGTNKEFRVVDGKNVQGTPFDYQNGRNSFDLSMDGNYFLEGALGGDHEIKFGVDYYTATTTTQTLFPNQRITYTYPHGEKMGYGVVGIFPDMIFDVSFKRISAYLQDTVTWGKLTASLGLRYDKETFHVNPFKLPEFTWYEPGSPYHGKPLFMDYIYPYETSGFDVPVSWELISPRVSLTYDITGDGKNVVKASFARYGGQSGNTIGSIYTTGFQGGWVGFYDENRDGIPQYTELFSTKYLNWYKFYPGKCPDTGLRPTQFAADYSCPYLDEITLKFEKAFGDDVAVALGAFYKRKGNLTHTFNANGEYVPFSKGIVGNWEVETKANWKEGGQILVGGSPLIFYSQINKPFGSYYTNLENSSESYRGVTLEFFKKLSNRWMLNSSFSIFGSSYNLDPNDLLDLNNFDFYNQGGLAFLSDKSALGGNFINSTWMYKFSALYQLPYGINLSSFFMAQSGNPAPQRRRTMTGTGPTYYYEPGTKMGDDRLPAFWMLNLGLEKTFQVTEKVTASVVIDWYNATNNQIEIRRNLDIGAAANPDIAPLMWTNAGLFQFGVRVDF